VLASPKGERSEPLVAIRRSLDSDVSLSIVWPVILTDPGMAGGYSSVVGRTSRARAHSRHRQTNGDISPNLALDNMGAI
jgi:hypothetical protein